MASNGLINKAKSGTCRVCLRRRSTEKYVKPVGEVHHGFAVGHIWECQDEEECYKVARARMRDPNYDRQKQIIICRALIEGRWRIYWYFT